MKSRKIIGIICIITSLILSVILVTTSISEKKSNIPVVVANTTITKGAKITEKDVKVINVNKLNVPENAIAKTEDVIGQYAKYDMLNGDAISSVKIVKNAILGDEQLNNIPSGYMAVSFSAKDMAYSLANKLQVGDIIRIHQYYQEQVLDIDELKFLKVISVTDSTGIDVSKKENEKEATATEEKLYTTITVIVTNEQAKEIARIENMGGLYVSLINRGDMELGEELLAKQADILNQKYQPQQ